MNSPENLLSEQKISGLEQLGVRLLKKKIIRVMQPSLQQSVNSYTVVSNMKE
jgi:hypothetical protein